MTLGYRTLYKPTTLSYPPLPQVLEYVGQPDWSQRLPVALCERHSFQAHHTMPRLREGPDPQRQGARKSSPVVVFLLWLSSPVSLSLEMS